MLRERRFDVARAWKAECYTDACEFGDSISAVL